VAIGEEAAGAQSAAAAQFARPAVLGGSGLGDRGADAGRTVEQHQIAVRNDHALDRQLGDTLERCQQRLAFGLVDEHVEPPR
jgi:hypothetical protein